MNYNVNEKVCPREFEKFTKWHKAACSIVIDGKTVMQDPLTSEERYDQLCSVWKEQKVDFVPRKKVS